MKWTFRIGKFWGIDVFLHATFFVMIVWLGISYWIQGNNIVTALTGVGFILALFGSVVLHEYGHALTARRFGVETKNITLYPIGGVASLERIPEKPKQELLVALAGPAVNLVISLVILLGLLFTSSLQPLTGLGILEGSFFQRLMIANLTLVGFNLIPAFPMDGGRVLRALLAMRLEYTAATQIAASVGQGLAFVFGLIGLFSNPFLVFIAFFVWIGAQNEAKMVRMNSALEGIPVSRAMLTDFEVLSPADQLSKVIDHVLRSDQKHFPVVLDDQVVGVLSETGLLQGLRNKGEETLVAEVMEHNFRTADSYEMLETAFNRLRECACHTMPILRNGELVGLVTMDNIGELIRIQSILDLREGPAKNSTMMELEV
ncbi:MAG: site-2 protease family protein [Anaerolineales bacterium]|nr:site-2 protease family protein [Anaerolineales bacterium]